MLLTVSALLLLAVPADDLRVRLPAMFPVGGVLFPPLPATLAAPLGVSGIACELLPAVIDAPVSLAFGPGTDQLIGVRTRGLKRLLAIWAVARRQRTLPPA